MWIDCQCVYLNKLQALAQELTGATVGELASDSRNVVDLIENAYRVSVYWNIEYW